MKSIASNSESTERFSMLINGALVAGTTAFDVVDPATGQPFAQAPECSRQQLDEAVESANTAFTKWSRTPFEERKTKVLEYGEKIRANIEAVAELVSQEVGKPQAKGTEEVNGGLFWLEGFAKIDPLSEVLRDTDTQTVETQRRPLGVVGAIIPWNYPALTALWKIAPALLTGNTLVLKPSPYTPLATLKLAELAADVFAAGVINIVTGGNELGAWMTEHPGIRKIAFTGSTATGKKIMVSGASNLKRMTLELGGNDAGIVLDDIDPAAWAEPLFWSKFSNCGQVCAALKRLYVPGTLSDAITESLIGVAEKVVVGPASDATSQIGPLQNSMQLEKVRSAVDDALSKGAEVAFQGDCPDAGYFFPVTILTNVTDDMLVLKEELFGPVLPVISYDTEDDAIRMANATEYGLGASVWSPDIERAKAIARQLEAGSIWVNQHPSMGPDIPYGGIKQSGIGVECGRWGLDEYTSINVLNVKLS